MDPRIEKLPELQNCFPRGIFPALRAAAKDCGVEVYLVGGTIRDWLLGGRLPGDVDLTIDGGAHRFCRKLIGHLGGGAFVPLGTEEEEASRVVWQGLDIDVSSFRRGARTIEEDLALRDFTINSLGAPLTMVFQAEKGEILDPLSGMADLEAGVLRHGPRAFVDDPLRLLRTFRFMVHLGFEVSPDTLREVSIHAREIENVAAERIGYELELIISAKNGSDGLWQMHQFSLLYHLLPELYEGDGLEQPGFHHLDVFQHNFQALREMEHLLARADFGYPGHDERFAAYLAGRGGAGLLKWAALLHDVGKPTASDDSQKEPGRVTFYGHDEIGRQLVENIGMRFKWRNEQRQQVGHLVAMHMHPFHLCTAKKKHGLTKRAALKLCGRAGDHLEGLFLLAMADSLASKGELKPEKIEQELIELYDEVITIFEKDIEPVLTCKPLVTGRDLIESFGLQPGPGFSVILKELQALQVEGVVKNREDAFRWVNCYVKENEQT